MTMKSFFGELFRNKVFIITYIILMIIVAIVLGLYYGGDGTTTYHCTLPGSNEEVPCPEGLTDDTPFTSPPMNIRINLTREVE